VDGDLKHLLEAMREENAAARQENATAHDETRRHFDVMVERIETRFDFLAETVQHVSEELQRTRVSLDGKIDLSAAETQAMIKFSHRELDRRVTSLEEGHRALEETVADLQSRLQRVESGAH
jgi:chaperonin cofactor prefoldin